MAYNLRWRRAAILSIIFHVFLVTGVGYLSAHMLTTPVTEEKYLEMELMNEPQVENPRDNTVTPMPASSIDQSTPLSARTPQVTSAPSTAISKDATPVVSTEGLTVTSVSSSSSNEISKTSAEATGNGIPNNTNNAGTKSKSSGIIPPSILNKTDPPYPQAARQAGIEGSVVVKIQIFENGRAGRVSVSRSSGNEQLDNAAIATVSQWHFVPAKDRDSGQAVACYTTIPISFHLK